MTEAATRIARTFHPRDWVEFTLAFLRIRSFVGGRNDLALACITRDLREERLHAALVGLDGTIKMLLKGSDWQQRTVCAPLIPEEGVSVDPYEEGRYFIWRAGLDERYPTSPATPATPVDRQLCAEGGSEQVARAEKMEPATGIAGTSQPPLPLKDWLPKAVNAHVKASDVPDKISTFARMLFNDAKAAFNRQELATYPASAASIETMLRQLKLWPPPKYPRK
jgi:hypothetical protein